MKLLVGCPIYKRSWIFSSWYDHLIESLDSLDAEVSLAFVVDDDDQETVDSILAKSALPGAFLSAKEESKDKQHSWSAEDFPRMAELRNILLEYVRNEMPDYFLSLDSDLLIEKDCVPALLHGAELGYDAVGMVTSMCRDIWCESWMYYAPTANGFVRAGQRADSKEHFKVDAIMAGKLMSPKAYFIDYRGDPQGEDLGWNRSCHDAYVSRGVHGAARARHVMFQKDLDKSPVNFW